MSTFSDDLEESMKPPLPPNWEERISKKHPDKPYYYNKKTKKSSWLPPVDKSGEVLLSYDKNLCNKALLHNIPTLSRDEPLDKIELKTSPENDFLANSLHCFLETEQNDDCHSIQKELLEAEDIMEEGKALLKKVLDEVIMTSK
ncbi:unnamed protein product [Trichogramma brassicae]|uniref:WW domain-containing protein n=1 Tax=Trichogramma brassicae TaxID=86971 RepID=A0A6H5I7K1_9HYME|nr:unnamed protein product [Trichogramma brassicae]